MVKLFSQTTVWLVILAVGIGLVVFGYFSSHVLVNPPNGTVTPISSVSPSSVLAPTSTSVRMPAPSIKVIGQTATCQLTGSINFINDNLYETKGAKISYQNVDDKIRQIYWKTNPDDEALVVGPNLFEQLVIPNGERQVGVSLVKSTNVKSYLLTAQVTYGVREPNGDVRVKIANCSGSVIVNMH